MALRQSFAYRAGAIDIINITFIQLIKVIITANPVRFKYLINIYMFFMFAFTE